MLTLIAGRPQVLAQQSSTLYLMHQVPQSNLLNPAVQASCKWFVGIPGLSSVHLSYGNSSFSINDLIAGNTWDLEGIYNQLHRVDLYSMEAQLALLSAGYRFRSYYFTFNLSDRVYLWQTVPRDLAQILIHGNGPFIGSTATFDALRPAMSYFREYSFGASKVIDSYWTIGARAKILFGKTGIVNNRSDLGVTTGEEKFDLIFNGNYTLNASFPVTLSQDANGVINDATVNDINIIRFLLNRANPGLAVDAGIIYRVDDRTVLSASVLDVGLIRWRTDLNNVNASGSFSFQGVDAGTDVISNAFANEMTDSVLNSFTFTLTGDPFSSFLSPQVFLGGSKQLNKTFTIGAVNRNVFYRHKIRSSLTVSARADLIDRVAVTFSWSYLNNSLKNLGAGLAYYGKGFQFHMVSDNFLGMVDPFGTRTLNLRMGMNLLFGCPGNKRARLQNDSYSKVPKGGNCAWAESPRDRAKKLRKRGRR